MVHRVSGERQAPALDRVREDHARLPTVPLGRVEGVQDGGEIMAPHVADQLAKRGVRDPREEPVEGPIGLAVGRFHERRSHGAGGRPQQRVVLGIGHRLEPRAEALAPGPREQGAKLRSPAQLDHAPAGRAEPRLELTPPRVRRDAVQALAVQVHDPEQVVQLGDGLLQQRLPHVALVQLGVPHHGDEPLGPPRARAVAHIARGQRPEGRHHGAEPHRARGQLHHAGIFPPARIGLESAEAPQAHELVGRQPPAQVLDGIEDRRGMGLHGHHLAGLERLEVERGHQRDDGGGRRLMPADLGPVGIGSRVVGVVHHVGAEPQDLPLDGVEEGQLGVGSAHRCDAHSTLPQARDALEEDGRAAMTRRRLLTRCATSPGKARLLVPESPTTSLTGFRRVGRFPTAATPVRT